MMDPRHYQNCEIRWCRYSDVAMKSLRPQKPYRVGRLLRRGYSRVNSYSNGPPYAVVMWNGLRTPTRYHDSFIEVFATTPDVTLDIPHLPIFPHLLRSFAWRAA